LEILRLRLRLRLSPRLILDRKLYWSVNLIVTIKM
jgi:hypothetical protein